MKDNIRIYYYFIIGAIGGLTGWLLSTMLSSFLDTGIVSQILYGAALGAVIGIAVSSFDGISNRSFRRFMKFGGIGFLLGATVGAIALPLTQVIYGLLVATVNEGQSSSASLPLWKFLIGTMCWILFGGFIGLGEGIGKGSQIWKGLVGGMLGGLLGGIIYETNRAIDTSSTGTGDNFQRQFFLAVSFTLLGAAVSAAVAFVTSALKSAWMEVLDGKLAGRNYDITKYVDRNLGAFRSGIIGSDEWSSHIYLPGDNEILSNHAEINYENGTPTISVTPEAGKHMTTFLNGRRLTGSSPLTNGDRIQVGSTNLIYRNTK
jgi:FHA domain